MNCSDYELKIVMFYTELNPCSATVFHGVA